jgi:hypothetical protein
MDLEIMTTGKIMMKFPKGWKEEGKVGSKVNNQKNAKKPSHFKPELNGDPSFPIMTVLTTLEA